MPSGSTILATGRTTSVATERRHRIDERSRAARNAALPDARKMAFRIGINLGDVLVEGECIYGDGVNIAARMEGLAEAGGICLSGTAYDQVENKLALEDTLSDAYALLLVS